MSFLNDIFRVQLEARKGMMWKPQPDITAYELAKLLPLLICQHYPDGFAKMVESLPPECLRHLEEMK